MSKVDKLEDLIAWSKSKDLAIEIYKFTNNGLLNKDYGLRDQIRRSAVSISSNIAEGFGRGGNKEFINFLSIAKGSAYELKTQLMIAKEIEYIDSIIYDKFMDSIETISKIITGLIIYLSNSNQKGPKFTKQF